MKTKTIETDVNKQRHKLFKKMIYKSLNNWLLKEVELGNGVGDSRLRTILNSILNIPFNGEITSYQKQFAFLTSQQKQDKIEFINDCLCYNQGNKVFKINHDTGIPKLHKHKLSQVNYDLWDLAMTHQFLFMIMKLNYIHLQNYIVKLNFMKETPTSGRYVKQ